MPLRYCLFFLLLLAGCRAERVAFQFQPGPPPTLLAADSACHVAPRVGKTVVAPPVEAGPPRHRRALATGRPAARPVAAARPLRLGQVLRAAAAVRAATRAAVRPASPRITVGGIMLLALLYFTSGLCLGIGGVQLAVHLGSTVGPWLGLLVGVPTVLLGLALMLFSVGALSINGSKYTEPVTFLTWLGYAVVLLGLLLLAGPLALTVAPGVGLLVISLGCFLAARGKGKK